MKEISYEDALLHLDPFFIDVRSPCEFSRDHIPGSINMAIFDDEERSEIGRIYRMLGRETAIVRGSEIVGLKIGDIVANIRSIKKREIVINCLRGGLRSTSLVSLLSSLGFRVYKLKDGYKGYRRYVSDKLSHIEIKPKIFVLQGLTGTGKTEIIRGIKNSIDLEGMAGHRSSVFGGIGLEQRTQKMFESLLLRRIFELNEENYIILEGESRKIGNIHIPYRILDIIYNSPTILIEASIERRVEILLKEYANNINPEEILAIVESIESRIGKKNVRLLIELFNRGELSAFVQLLLEKYYDPLYRFSLDKMRFIAKINNINSDQTIREVERIVLGNIR